MNEFLNNNPDIVPDEYPLITLDRKSAVCMTENGKDTNNTRYIARRPHFVSNDEIEKCKRLTGMKEF